VNGTESQEVVAAPSGRLEVEPSRSNIAPNPCPRCNQPVRHRVCAYCRLRLYCRSKACGVRLADPLHQTVCSVCGTPVAQSAAPDDAASSGGVTETPTPFSSALNASLAPVAALVEAHRKPGDARTMAAGYALALLGQNRVEEAEELLARALEEGGSEPSRVELLLLRAHCARSLGRPTSAIPDLLEAAAEDTGVLAAITAEVHKLLPAADADAARLELLEHWAPRVRKLAAPDDAVRVAALELHAAVLLYDEPTALAAIRRAELAAGERGIESCRDVLRKARVHAPADGRLFATLALVEQAAGLRDEAIEDVDRAVALGLPATGERLTEIRMLQFKAGLYDPDKEPTQAAQAFKAAGHRASFMEDLETAVELLERAASLDHQDSETRWHLAEMLRVKAQRLHDPEARLPLLHRAREEWEAGRAMSALDEANAWVLEILALVYDGLASSDRMAGRDYHWQGALALERRIILDEGTADSWAMLAMHYHDLDLNAVASLAASSALGFEPAHLGALLTALMAQRQLGDPHASETLDRILENPSAADYERGIALVVVERYQEAVERLRTAIDDEWSALNARYLLAYALREVGEAEAEKQFEEIWHRLQKGDILAGDFGLINTAEVAYTTGREAEAVTLLAPVQDQLSRSSYSVADGLGILTLALLSRGELDGAQAAFRRARAWMRGLEDVEFLQRELRRLAERLRRKGSTEVAMVAAALIAELVELADGIRREDHGGEAAVRVLQATRERTKHGVPVHPQAIDLALGRLLLEQQRWDEAAEEYLAALDHQAWDPHERDAITERLLVAVDALLRAGRAGPARSALDRALAMHASSSQAPLLRVRRVLAALALGDAHGAQRAAAAAEEVDTDVLAGIVERCVAEPAQLRRLLSQVQDLGLSAFVPALARRLNELFKLNEEEGTWQWPIVNPIVLEIATDLVPADTSPDGPMFGEYLPAMRRRIEEATGVRIPGVRVREVAGLLDGTFRFRIGESWPQRGAVQLGSVFVSRTVRQVQARLGSRAVIQEAIHPVMGDEGCWVQPFPDGDAGLGGPAGRRRQLGRVGEWWVRMTARSAWQSLVSDAGVWEEPIAYTLLVLESHLRRHAMVFLAVDEAARMLEDWRSEGLLDEAEATELDLPRLTSLFRDLLGQLVPLRPAVERLDGLVRASDPKLGYEESLLLCRACFTGGT
jgi:tetratricopeptide (TPR) repeat protein